MAVSGGGIDWFVKLSNDNAELRAEVERLRAALALAREALPARKALPITYTRMGEIVDAVEAALRTSPSPGTTQEGT